MGKREVKNICEINNTLFTLNFMKIHLLIQRRHAYRRRNYDSMEENMGIISKEA
jgi:hypothetical protein